MQTEPKRVGNEGTPRTDNTDTPRTDNAGTPNAGNAGAPQGDAPRRPRRRRAPRKPSPTVPAENAAKAEEVPARPPKRAQGEPAHRNGRLPAGEEAVETTTPAPHKNGRGRRAPKQTGQPLHIIPLGGLDEIGKNMTAYECGDDIFVVDCGSEFPDDEMLGVDLVVPDVTWLEKNKDRVHGIVLTHGHEDHIGGLPYVLKIVNVPVYGTRLTLGILEGKLKEHGLLGKVKLNVIAPGDVLQFGCMSVEFINVTHSIAGSVAVAITTPVGVVVQTGDFKIDCTPILGDMIDLARFGELGKQGVLALLMDSTNSERPGYSMSERKVGESFDGLFQRAQDKRIIIATFASNVHRVQQIVNAAQYYGRHVAISGRSMVNVCGIATELGYLDIPEGLVVDLDVINRYPPEKMVVITTGSQGEPMSALYRMAFSDHNKIEVGPSDFIILSASPIPGNEKTVSKMVNELMRLGAEVVYESLAEVHASGHAYQEELKIMLGLTHPKYFIPVHGEQKHLRKNAKLGMSMGVPYDHILITEIGKVVELTPDSCKVVGTVPAGRVLVDGLGVGDVGSIVLRDRKHLAQDGLIVVVATIDGGNGALVSGPDIVSRGFVYVRESEPLMEETRRVAREVLAECSEAGVTEWGTIKTRVKDALSKLLYDKTKRNPMILPVIMEI